VDLYNVYGSCISGNGKMSGADSGFYKAPLGKRSLKGPDACIDSIYARCVGPLLQGFSFFSLGDA
jgi:hypothetical protein